MGLVLKYNLGDLTWVWYLNTTQQILHGFGT